MTKKSNSFKNIITVLMALLLLGIAAAPASAYAVNNATATIITGTAIANASAQNSINISFNTSNNSATPGYFGNWSINVSAFPLTTNLTVQGFNWLNLTINATGNASLCSDTSCGPRYLYGTNNTTLGPYLGGKGGFNASNGTIYVLLNTSNATDPNTFSVTFQNLDNTSETATLTPLKFIAGPLVSTSLTNISTSAVANNSNNYTMNVSAFDAANNPIRNLTTTITLTSNRSQDTLTPSSVTTFVANTTNATINITSYLAGQVMINATAPIAVTNASSTNPVFIPGPPANLAIYGSASVTGVVNNTQYVAIQDAYGNNVTIDRLANMSLLASVISGSAGIASTNPVIINIHTPVTSPLTITGPPGSLLSTQSNISANGINYTATFTPVNFTVSATSAGVGAVTLQVTSNASLNGTSRAITYYGGIASLGITTNKSTLYANNSDTMLVTVQLKDSNGNNIQSSGVTIQLNSLTPTLFNPADLSTTNTTNALGVALFTVRSTAVSGTGTIGGVVTVNPAGNTGQTGTSSTITSAQAPSIGNSNLTNSSASIFTGTNTTLIARIKDYSSNGVPSWQVTFNITTGSATFANNSATLYTVNTDAAGNAYAAITSTNASSSNLISVNVTLVDEKLKTQSVGLENFSVTPGVAAQLGISPSTNIGLPNTLGASQLINITIKDSVGNANNTASGTINITTSNPSLGNMTNGSTAVTNNFVIAITGNTTFTYQVNSTTVGTAVLNLNSSLGIMTNITISTSGAAGINLTFTNTTPLIGTNTSAIAQLTDASGNALGINGTSISFTVTNATGVLQSVATNTTNAAGNAIYLFNQSVAGVYSVTATNVTQSLTNTSTVTFAGQPASIAVTVNNSSPTVNGTISINATFKDASGVTSGGLNGQTVQFLANNVPIGSAAPITNGIATTTYTKSTAGAVNITAFYNSTLQGTTSVTFTAAAAPTLTSITVTPANATITSDQTQQFTATGNVAISPATVWSSSNTTVGAINATTGLFTATKVGTTTITATNGTNGTVSGSTSLTVTVGNLSTITVSPSAPTVQVNTNQTFTAAGADADGNAVSITPAWNSSNSTVGTINSAGVFTALVAGTTTVNATNQSITGSATVTVVIQIVNGTITGTVTNASSTAAISGATVTVSGMTATTNANGSYSIGIAPGTYTVTASATGYNSSSASVTVGSGATVTQNFALQPTVVLPGTITGTVTNASSGAAIAGATVTAGSATATTNANGTYTISIAAGTYTVTASATGYTSSSASVTVASGATATKNFALTPTGAAPLVITASRTNVTTGLATSVVFTVTDGTNPVSGATVTLSGSATGTGTTGAAGTATISVTATSNATATATASKAGFTSGTKVLVAKGDVNGDGQVTIVDALFIAQSTVGTRTIDTVVGDVNGDGQVSIVDALFIAQYTVNTRPDPTT